MVATQRAGAAGTAIRRKFTPPQLLTLGFLVLILIGWGVLSLPVARQAGVAVSPLDTLFTATSAACLCGLVTVSTAGTWSPFGQVVLLLLIEGGALLYMTTATMILLLLGVRLGGDVPLFKQDTLASFSLRHMLRLLGYVTAATLLIQAAGAVILFLRFLLAHHLPAGPAAFHGIFYAVTAFCNAGFTLTPGFSGMASAPIQSDLVLLLVISLLVILGGLGFIVLAELALLPRIRRLSLHTRVVLCASFLLLVLGMLAFYLFEYYNPQTLARYPGQFERALVSWFMSVTPRSAGFSPVDIQAVTPPTLFILGLLMIIGASPGGTGAGIKTTTVAIIVLAILTLLRRRSDIEVFRRRISGETVRLALSLVTIYLLGILLFIFGISIVEITLKHLAPTAETMARYGHLMFEVVAAFGTTGLSAGITPTLEPVSRLLLILAMYLGRVGPIIFVYVFAQPKQPQLRRLPTETIVTG